MAKSNQDEYKTWLTGWNEEKWLSVFQDYPAQSEFTVHTNLWIGSDREAYIEFQGRYIRWINPEPDRSAVLVIPATTRDSYRVEDYNLAQSFLNYATFETDCRASIVGMSSYMRRIAPLLMPSRELSVVWSEERLSSEGAELSFNLEFASGLYREGINNFHISPFLAFLSFYKVLELAILPLYKGDKDKFAGSNALKAWFNDAERISPSLNLDQTRLNQVRAFKESLGEYFYTQCRCAIAHTEHDPLANPNLSVDHQRIGNDMYVMRDLAHFAIVSKLGTLANS